MFIPGTEAPVYPYNAVSGLGCDGALDVSDDALPIPFPPEEITAPSSACRLSGGWPTTAPFVICGGRR